MALFREGTERRHPRRTQRDVCQSLRKSAMKFSPSPPIFSAVMVLWRNSRKPRQRSALAPAAFIDPCLPSRAVKAPSAQGWIHEIKHDDSDCSPSAAGLYTDEGIICAGENQNMISKHTRAIALCIVVSTSITHGQKFNHLGSRYENRCQWKRPFRRPVG